MGSNLNPQLYDMSGNVWEWCENKLNENRNSRVLRGGAWYGFQAYARAAYRDDYFPDSRFSEFGFRVCRRCPPISS